MRVVPCDLREDPAAWISRLRRGDFEEISGFPRAGPGLPLNEEWSRPAAPRGEVARALADANEALGNPRGAALARRLADSRTLVVATGQQPGLFGGPLLVAIKLAVAVRLAADMERWFERPVVPLYWNHSEDHDLAESNRFAYVENGDLRKFSLPVAGAGAPLEAIRFDPEHRLLAADFLRGIGIPEGFVPEVSGSWSEHHSKTLLALLPGFPAIHAEPRHLRRFLGPFREAAVEQAAAWREGIADRTRSLAPSGFTPQIPPDDDREFFMILDEDGRRRRLLRTGSRYQAGGREWTGAKELLHWMDDHPDSVSSTVASRPLLVQHLLPVATHVLGPGEMKYFAQIAPLFSLAGLPAPALLLRPGATILREKDRRSMDEAGLPDGSVLRPPREWPPEGAGAAASPDPALERAAALIGDGLDALDASAGEIGRGIAGAFTRRTRDGLARALEALAKQRDQGSRARRVRRLQLAARVHPGGELQERVLGPLALFGGFARTALANALSALDLFESRHQLVFLDDGETENP